MGFVCIRIISLLGCSTLPKVWRDADHGLLSHADAVHGTLPVAAASAEFSLRHSDFWFDAWSSQETLPCVKLDHSASCQTDGSDKLLEESTVAADDLALQWSESKGRS